MSDQYTLTVSEAKELKLRLELMIGDMLMNFSNKTGHVVEGINVGSLNAGFTQGHDSKVLSYSVEIDARL